MPEFHKNKQNQTSSRHFSTQRLLADQINCKVLCTGVLKFVSNNSESQPGIKLWVSQTGSDTTGNGSEESPFATLTKALSDLSQQVWDGGANIFVDGKVTVAGSNFACPLTPAPGISGKPYEISIKGANVATEGPFTVGAVGSYAPGTIITRTDFASVTVVQPAPITASKGKMIHFLSGALAGLRVPIYAVSGKTLSLVEPSPTSIIVGDTFEIETHGDCLDLAGGLVVLSSLSRIPLCLRNLDLTSSDGSQFTTNDYAGSMQLLGVKVVTTSGVGFFNHNLFAQGVWVTGAGALQTSLVSRSFVNRALYSGSSTPFSSIILSNLESVHSVIIYEGGSPAYGVGSHYLKTIARTGATALSFALVFGLALQAFADCISVEGELDVDAGAQLTLGDCEVTGTVGGPGIRVQGSTVYFDTISADLHGNGNYGILATLGSKVRTGVLISSTANGTAGIGIETGSSVRVDSGSTISGPGGDGVDNYEVNGGGVMSKAAAPDIDASDLAEIAFY